MNTFVADLFLLVAAYGLALPVGYGGLPFVGQGAFVAAGAFGTFQLAAHGLPVLLGVVVAVAGSAVAGYAVGFAAARVAGASLALASWGLAWLGYRILQQFPAVSGGSSGLFRPQLRLVSPGLGVTLTVSLGAFAVVASMLVLLVAFVVRRAERGPLGLDWAALRTSPALADSLGVAVARRRRALLAWSAALGALGGAGTALAAGVISPADYSPLLSLQLFVAVILVGTGTWWGPVVGVAAIAGLPSLSDHLASGLGVDPLRAEAAVTAGLLVIALALRSMLARWLRRDPRASRAAADEAWLPDMPGRTPGEVLLSLRDVSISFGAVQALDGVDVDVRAGEVHALIGPNGSGKTTLIAVAAGTLRPQRGEVWLAGAPHGFPAAAAPRVRAGVVRTWQQPLVFGAVTATEVAVAAQARETHAGLGLRELAATPLGRQIRLRRNGRVATALDITGLAPAAASPSATLNGADRSRLQVARAVATGAPVLLLDEPAAGVVGADRDRLAALLRALAASGRGVLLVEHDVALVLGVADRVTVLDAGRVICSGPPEVVRHDPAVRRAYLGDHAPRAELLT